VPNKATRVAQWREPPAACLPSRIVRPLTPAEAYHFLGTLLRRGKNGAIGRFFRAFLVRIGFTSMRRSGVSRFL